MNYSGAHLSGRSVDFVEGGFFVIVVLSNVLALGLSVTLIRFRETLPETLAYLPNWQFRMIYLLFDEPTSNVPSRHIIVLGEMCAFENRPEFAPFIARLILIILVLNIYAISFLSRVYFSGIFRVTH